MVGWLAWPLLRPWFWHVSGSPWLVVLDGYHRLDWALQRQARSSQPILLITCPATAQPTPPQWVQQRQASCSFPQSPPMLVLQEGFDTATQVVALAQWLQRRQRQGDSLWGCPGAQACGLVSAADVRLNSLCGVAALKGSQAEFFRKIAV